MNIWLIVIIAITIIAIVNRICEMIETKYMSMQDLMDFIERHENEIKIETGDKENE